MPLIKSKSCKIVGEDIKLSVQREAAKKKRDRWVAGKRKDYR